MPLKLVLLFVVLAGVVGIGLGYLFRWLLTLGKRGSMELEIKQKLLEAREEAERITSEATDRAEQIIDEARDQQKEKEKELKTREERLLKREELIDTRQLEIDKESAVLRTQEEELEERSVVVEEMETKLQGELERIARMTEEEARAELLKTMERSHEEDVLVRLQKIERGGQEAYEKKAREILATVIHRLGNSVSSDLLSTNVSLPSDEVKGKIIGKEGRNIKAFERASGVEVIIDDTPGVVVISSFDPLRRQVARVALENLILDGRIQPARIEEEVDKARQEINRIVKEKGEEAVFECGIYNLDPRVVSILGRLHFRTSYGQNVLQHSIEVAHLAGMLAEELGADVQVAKAGGLLHDIGKAVDHEIPGSHVNIGMRILQKFGVDEAVITAMKSHHEEYPYESIEAIIVQVADAISGSRPGARSDTVENYLRRLAELETVANSIDGVDKSYAIQAGREVRIFVNPDSISDLEARSVAREIATRIEQELRYPGEIKITVIRESRIIEFAR